MYFGYFAEDKEFIINRSTYIHINIRIFRNLEPSCSPVEIVTNTVRFSWTNVRNVRTKNGERIVRISWKMFLIFFVLFFLGVDKKTVSIGYRNDF